MQQALSQLEPIKYFLSDPTMLECQNDPQVFKLYQEYMAGIKFSVSPQLKASLFILYLE